jgi:hypothetical protein
MDDITLCILIACAVMVLLVPCTARREGFRTLVRTDRDTIPLKRGQKFFPRKAGEADQQGTEACQKILGSGWSYASWEPSSRDGGAYNCFRNVYKH